jgi:4-amino-4-deoxy-L-arabinose transferase-like glycosyltransferase
MRKNSVNKKYWWKSKILILSIVLIFSFGLRLLTLNQMGRTWDELEYIEPGYKLDELIMKKDLDNSYFYTTYNHPPLIKYLYGLTAHLDAEKVVKGEPIFRYDLTYSRLLSALVFSLGVVITAFIGWEFVSPLVGIVAGVILAMLPFSLGLSQLVTTESFKIFIYPLAFYSYLLILKKYSLKKVISAGVITGIALQIKQSNALLMPLFGLMYFFVHRQVQKKKEFFNKSLFSLLWIAVIAVIVFMAFWPQGILHYKEVNAINNKLWQVHFSPNLWQITLSPPEIFFGRLMMTPTLYYVVYFFISIPALILAFFFLGAFKIYKGKDWILTSIILWFAVPFIMSVYSWRQHGLRYIIEIYPAIALIAAIGFNSLMSKFTNKERLKLLYFIPVIIYLSIVLWQIKPYYLDYFNELAGGTNTVYKYKLFQQGWWGQGIREAGLYVKDTAPKGSKIGYALSPAHVLPRFDHFIYEKWSKDKKYDYVIVNYYNIIREGFNDKVIRKNYRLVYEVRADKAVLVYVYKRK